jgi:hypothetical protein
MPRCGAIVVCGLSSLLEAELRLAAVGPFAGPAFWSGTAFDSEGAERAVIAEKVWPAVVTSLRW